MIKQQDVNDSNKNSYTLSLSVLTNFFKSDLSSLSKTGLQY